MKLFCLTPFFLIISFVVCSQIVSLENAKEVALNFYNLKVSRDSDLKSVSIDSVALLDVIRIEKQTKSALQDKISEPLYYVFCINNEGFVIVAGEKNVFPVLAYSFTGRYSINNQSPNYRYWMKKYQSQIEYIRDNSIIADSIIQKEWNKYESGQILKVASNVTSISPILQTEWSQGCRYNNYCPEDDRGSCGRVPVGCVAVAMGQIMKKWCHPLSCKNIPDYEDKVNKDGDFEIPNSNYGWINGINELSIKWNDMKDNLMTFVGPLNEYPEAQLLYYCGVSVKMNYGPYGSSSNSNEVVNALKNYFNYSPSLMLIWKAHYSDYEWKLILRDELENDRPIYYSGDNGEVGHAFVIDGYDGTDYFHINWGWGGSANAYFYLDNLTPLSHSFNNNQGAIIGIEPSDTYNITAPILTASKGTFTTYIHISWSNVLEANGYDLYRSTSNDILTATKIASISSGSIEYDDTNVQPETYYYYWVKAVSKSNGNYIYSDFSSSDKGWLEKTVNNNSIASFQNGGIATAISEGTYNNVKHYAYLVNDGDNSSAWCSQWSMPAWLEIKFDKLYLINKVGVFWGAGTHNQEYSISLSIDGNNWTTVVPTRSSNTTAGYTGSVYHGSENESHEEFEITPQNAQYIKIDISNTSAPYSHIFQAIIHELEAFAQEDLEVTSLTINGPSNMNENSSASYICIANYSDGTSQDVTSLATWSEDSDYAVINSNGVLTTSSVGDEQSCIITASYGGKSDTHTVIIIDEPNNLLNVALSQNGGTANAISEGTYSNVKHYSYLANDGDNLSAWCSQWSMPAWLDIKFDKLYLINKVGVFWGAGTHNQEYSISLSIDGNNWKTVVPTRSSNTTAGYTGSVYHGSENESHEEFEITSQNAQYIKIDVSNTSAPYSHIFQAIVHELAAYAQETNTNDTLAKLNFTYNDRDVDDWTSIYGGNSFPVELNNGITIDMEGNTLGVGMRGEESSTVMPNEVGTTYNWMSNTDNESVMFTISGLEPDEEYTFIIYASRTNDQGLTENRTTSYTVLHQISNISGSINPVGNTDQLVILNGIKSQDDGTLVMEMSKLDYQYGYINAWVIVKQKSTNKRDFVLKEIVIYPNPVDENLILSNLPIECNIIVYNMQGTIVFSRYDCNDSEVLIKMDGLSSGLYFVKVVDTSGRMQNLKVIKR